MKYSVTSPVFGLSLPTVALKLPVYQMLPSLSAVKPCGPDLSGRRYSLIAPVFGSKRPSLFANCPVYQMAPSAVARGSCGRDPGVGTIHSEIVTFALPGMTTAAGLGRSGKFFDKYCTSGSTSFCGKVEPTLIIMLRLLRQLSAL